MILGRETVLILAVIQTVIAMAIGFGLQWTGEQVALTMTAVTAILALIARQTTTSLVAPHLPIGTKVNEGSAIVIENGE